VAKLVDRLLAAPHFGSAGPGTYGHLRYTETHATIELRRHHAWRYPIILIRAFNEDIPFDQIIRSTSLAICATAAPQSALCGSPGTAVPGLSQRFNESVIGTASIASAKSITMTASTCVHRLRSRR